MSHEPERGGPDAAPIGDAAPVQGDQPSAEQAQTAEVAAELGVPAEASRGAVPSDEATSDPASTASPPTGSSEPEVEQTLIAFGEGSAEPLPPAESRAAPEPDPALSHRIRLPSILESLLFAADHPLTAADLAELVGEPDVKIVDGALAVLGAEWAPRGIQLHAVAGGWQFRTHPANAPWVQKLVAQKPVRLSRPQLEALAIVAYRQPITRPEIDEIRGVDSGGTLKVLLERALIRILGKKEEPGRPLLYGTTREFLEFFNLRDLKELPTLREFHELSDEHRAQVEALERAAPPGTVEGVGPPEASPPPLARVELPDAGLDEDLSHIDSMISEAEARAKTVTAALSAAEGLGGSPQGTPSSSSPATPPATFDEAETPTPDEDLSDSPDLPDLEDDEPEAES